MNKPTKLTPTSKKLDLIPIVDIPTTTSNLTTINQTTMFRLLQLQSALQAETKAGWFDHGRLGNVAHYINTCFVFQTNDQHRVQYLIDKLIVLSESKYQGNARQEYILHCMDTAIIQ